MVPGMLVSIQGTGQTGTLVRWDVQSDFSAYVRVLEIGIRSRLPGLLCTLLSRAPQYQIDSIFERRLLRSY